MTPSGQSKTQSNLLGRFLWLLFAVVAPLAVSVVSIPLTTYKLSPKDFGLFSLVSSITALGPAVAGLGSSYVLANRFAGATLEEQIQTVSTLFWSGCAVLVGACGLLVAAYHWWIQLVPEIGAVPGRWLAWALLAMCAGFPWIIALDYLTLTAESRWFAVISIGQSLMTSGATLGLLYWVDLGAEALFAGATIGASFGGLLSLWSLRRHLRFRWSRSVGQDQFRLGGLLATSGLAEALQSTTERQLLARFVGLAGVGIYAHSAGYRRMVFSVIKSVSRTIWPETLSEAREPGLEFRQTRRVWAWVSAGLVAAGILLALWGDELIGWFTHGKFQAAAPLTAAWMGFLLVQFSGRSQMGYLFAKGKGPSYAACSLLASLGTIGLLFVLVPVFHLWGALLAVTISQLGLRLGVHLVCSRFSRLKFDDWPQVVGCLVIAGCICVERALHPAVPWRILLAIAAAAVFGLCLYREHRSVGLGGGHRALQT